MRRNCVVALVAAAFLWVSSADALPTLLVGPPDAAYNSLLLRHGNATRSESLRISVDLNADAPIARSFVVQLVDDTFRVSAPNQFRTSALILNPQDGRRYVRPYG